MPFVASVGLSLALAFVVMGPIIFVFDLWVHEGVSFFTRQSVRRSGVAAPARILSDKMLKKPVGRTGAPRSAYAIDYEVFPPGAPPFRARGIEAMTWREDTNKYERDVEARRQAAKDSLRE